MQIAIFLSSVGPSTRTHVECNIFASTVYEKIIYLKNVSAIYRKAAKFHKGICSDPQNLHFYFDFTDHIFSFLALKPLVENFFQSD